MACAVQHPTFSFPPGQDNNGVALSTQADNSVQDNGLVALFTPPETPSLLQELAVWAVTHSATHASVDDLLKILINHDHGDLPKCAKTLLKTPRSTNDLVKDLCGGQYWYGGILNGIISRQYCDDMKNVYGQNFTINIFVDGMSPLNKVKLHVVAIAGCIKGQKKPFVITLWTGRTPDSVNIHEFFKDFIAEVKVIMQEGFVLCGFFCKLVIEKYIGDTPAREWMLQLVMFNAYNGCERCTCKGIHICRRMTFELEEPPLRTDESVANQDHENHHKDVTPFREITSKLLSQFPLEPMHLVYLGVFRRFFSTLLKPKQKYILDVNSKGKLSVYVDSLRPYFPTELTGKPRPIEDWSQYKAAEWRRLGLYDGFLVFKFLLPDTEVPPRENLRKLHIMISCAIRILSDEKLLTLYRNKTDILLRRFVERAVSLFGQEFNVFNVHSLIHLSAETLLHGTLDVFSAWIYQSYLGTLKKLLRKPGISPEQIVCRLMEQRAVLPPERSVQREAAELSQPHHKGPTFGPSDQFRMISLRGMIIRVASSNDICFVTNTDEVCIVPNIIKIRNGISLVCNAFLDKSDFFSSPLSSQLLGICTVKRLSALKVYPLDVIKNKAVILPLHEGDVQEKPTCHWMDHVEDKVFSMIDTAV